MTAKLFIEGGGETRATQSLCRAAFSTLFTKAGFPERKLKLRACGGREQAFKMFEIAVRSNSTGEWIGLLVDSEEPIDDVEKTWLHLKQRDKWDKPNRAITDEDVLMMVTCMESWIIVDRASLRTYYGPHLLPSALPSVFETEKRLRHDIQEALRAATRKSLKRYDKGERSFILLEQVDPEVVRRYCPSFVRCCRILGEKLR